MSDVTDESVAALNLPDGEFALVGTVRVDEADVEEFEAKLKRAAQQAVEEKGTLHYCVSRDRKDLTLFHCFEQFESKAAFLEHASTAVDREIRESGMVKDMNMTVLIPIKP